MKNFKQLFKKKLVDEITNSKLSFNKQMKALERLDKKYRKYLGVIYLSDKELEENDILNRSM